MTKFDLQSQLTPQGDQPAAIAALIKAFRSGQQSQVLLGVTGSGKTYTMANVIAGLGKPAIVIAPNKTLAAQLFAEFRDLFPANAVEFFISYYDYYQPEAYVPSTDTYIAKDAAINDDIDKMRHSATRSLFERRDVIIVASVSCIYGLGLPDRYSKMAVSLAKGAELDRDTLLHRLVEINYTRNDRKLERGNFRVRGDTVDILPSHRRNEAIRVRFFGEEIDELSLIDSLTGVKLRALDDVSIYPNSHYVTEKKSMGNIVREILTDLGLRLRELQGVGKIVEYQRLEQRVMRDVEMLEQYGFTPGIENYSRYLNGLPPGHAPPTLLDYFSADFLTIIDESHITVPQLRGMYHGDRSRKTVLVDYGFRLPAALDNRPLNFDEFAKRVEQVLYVSATPSAYELAQITTPPVEQIIRPTGLIDPEIVVRPADGQVDDLLGEARDTARGGGRVLITTLTKRMAEEITNYYAELGLRIRYLHADIESLERYEILRALRQGKFDVLVGINLLREGLDLPEVELVGVFDADKEGFLRSASSLIQVVGRAARNTKGRVIFYADKRTAAMETCIRETDRRRARQVAHNTEHGIEPRTITKDLPASLRAMYGLEDVVPLEAGPGALASGRTAADIEAEIRSKSKRMQTAAADLEFEVAATLRDEIAQLRGLLIEVGIEKSDAGGHG